MYKEPIYFMPKAYKYSGLTLYVGKVCPPYDNGYYCVDENYDGAPDGDKQIVGEGDTELDAVEDYITKVEEQ